MNKIDSQRLTDIESGMSVVIERFEGGCTFKDKLISMGILPGKKVEILSARRNGPVVIKVNDTRLALGHGMANKIFVKK